VRREIKQPGKFLHTDLVEDAVVLLGRTGLMMGISRAAMVSRSLRLVAFARGIAARQRSQCALVLSQPCGVRA
jgi:hypothetical protein